MGCCQSKPGQEPESNEEPKINLEQTSKIIRKVAEVGGDVPCLGTCLTIVATILESIDASEKMPDFLRNCRSKLVHIQQLMQGFDDKKLLSSGVTQDFFTDLQSQLDEFKSFVEKKLELNQSQKKLDKLLVIFNGKDDVDKVAEFNQAIDSALQKFLLAKIHDDVSDTFPDFLKKVYKGKPGYDTWRQLFGNKEKKPNDLFSQRYALHNEVEPEKIMKLIDLIDRDKNGQITFEEYMSFIDLYIYYFDEKGSRIRKLDDLIKKLVEDIKNQDKITITDNKIVYPDGAVYEGQIEEGQRHGKGKYTKGTTYSYEGSYEKDIKTGFGVEIRNKITYTGQWLNNQKNGKGKIEYSDGSTYEGEFHKDLPEGQGVLISEGVKYTGTYLDGQMIKGVILYADKTRYEGETKETKIRHGRGRMLDASGKQTFQGNYRDDVPSQKFNYWKPEDLEVIKQNQKIITNLDIELDSTNNFESDVLSLLPNVEILQIKFSNSSNPVEYKDFAVQLLNQAHSDLKKGLQELHVIIPNEGMQKIQPNHFVELFEALKQFPNILMLNLSLQYWAANNELIDSNTIDELVTTYQQFTKLQHLKLDLHQWGYQNKKLQNEEIVSIIRGLEEFQEGQLKTLHLDLGRWGCDTYESYEFFTDITLSKMGDLLKNNKGMEELKLNIRSWGYKNTKLSNIGIAELFDGLGKLQNLRNLDLGMRGLCYQNNVKPDKTLESMRKCILKLQKLEKIKLTCSLWDQIPSEKWDSLKNDMNTKLSSLKEEPEFDFYN